MVYSCGSSPGWCNEHTGGPMRRPYLTTLLGIQGDRVIRLAVASRRGRPTVVLELKQVCRSYECGGCHRQLKRAHSRWDIQLHRLMWWQSPTGGASPALPGQLPRLWADPDPPAVCRGGGTGQPRAGRPGGRVVQGDEPQSRGGLAGPVPGHREGPGQAGA